ncbi:MAG: DUF177 domain-containing protein [Candidatus Sumerlaeia bacterium]|nr:DUF177 domain-containing protein [Candidatus Sumerlaeia bacterium]
MQKNKPRFQFETDRLKDGPITYEITRDPTEFDLLEDPEYRFLDPITGTLKLTAAGDTVVMQGEVRTVATAPCARCLESIRLPLAARVTLAFINDERLIDRESDYSLEEENSFYFDGEMIYPMEPLRELLLLELPVVPSCQLDPGDLCPVTGRKMGGLVFGAEGSAPDLPAPQNGDDEEGNSLREQVEKLRRKLEG